MFVKFGSMIINLDNVTTILVRENNIKIYMIGGKSTTTDILGADELEKVLSECNKMRGYNND